MKFPYPHRDPGHHQNLNQLLLANIANEHSRTGVTIDINGSNLTASPNWMPYIDWTQMCKI